MSRCMGLQCDLCTLLSFAMRLIELLTPRVEQDNEAVIIWEDPSIGTKVWLEKL